MEENISPLIWRMEENSALTIWSSIYLEDGGKSCYDDLEDELLHLICLEDGEECCSDDLELHLLGGWRRKLRFGG